MIRKDKKRMEHIESTLTCSMCCWKRFKEADSQIGMLDALDEIDLNCRAIISDLKRLGYSYEEAKEKLEYVGEY